MNTNASHASQLRVISLFEDLQPAEPLQVAGLCMMQACEKHTQIMGEQDQTTDVFFILVGAVRISSYTEAGREVIFTEMHAGDIFGEFSAVDEADCWLIAGPGGTKKDLEKYLEGHGEELKKKLVGVESMDHPTEGELLKQAHKLFEPTTA